MPTNTPTRKQYKADGIIVESSINVNPIVTKTFKTAIQRAVVRNFPSLNFCFMSAKKPGLAPSLDCIAIWQLLQKLFTTQKSVFFSIFFACQP